MLDRVRIEKNIHFLKTVSIPLSEKLDKVINPRLVPSNRISLQYIPDGDIKTPIDRPKLWISRVKKTSRIQSRTPKGGGTELLGHLLNREGQSLLQQAAYYGKVSIIRKLLLQGADVNQEDWYGTTALLYSIKANQVDSVKELLKCGNLNIVQKFGHRHETALIKAIKLGYTEIVAEICRNRCEVISKQDVDGRTPLFHSIIRGNVEMVLELIKAGSREKDLIDYKGLNAVYLAIDSGEINAVQTLLSYSEFDISDSTCEKLLLMGCYGNKLSLVQNAIPHISINHKIRESGLSPILISYSLGFADITNELIGCALNEEIEYVSPQGESLILLAARNNDKNMIKTLVEIDSDLNITDSKGRSALHEAAEKGFIEIITILLKRNVNINSQDIFGSTPLILACKNHKKEIVELLVRRGANIEIKDSIGRDAKSYSNREVCEILTSFSSIKRNKQKKLNKLKFDF